MSLEAYIYQRTVLTWFADLTDLARISIGRSIEPFEQNCYTVDLEVRRRPSFVHLCCSIVRMYFRLCRPANCDRSCVITDCPCFFKPRRLDSSAFDLKGDNHS